MKVKSAPRRRQLTDEEDEALMEIVNLYTLDTDALAYEANLARTGRRREPTLRVLPIDAAEVITHRREFSRLAISLFRRLRERGIPTCPPVRSIPPTARRL